MYGNCRASKREDRETDAMVFYSRLGFIETGVEVIEFKSQTQVDEYLKKL